MNEIDKLIMVSENLIYQCERTREALDNFTVALNAPDLVDDAAMFLKVEE